MTPARAGLAALLLLLTARLPAADPVAPLRPLVPPDAAVVFVVRDLGPRLKELGASPMAAWFATSAAGRQFVDPKEAEKLAALRDFLTAQLGVTSEQLRDDLFGDAVVFAFQPGEPGRPETDTGTLLVRPRDPAALEKLVARVNAFQQATGEVTALRTAEHKGVRYTVREKPAAPREFYCLFDGTFALTTREAALRGVIERSQPPAAVPKWLALDDGTATLAALFNPRAHDAAWAVRAAGGGTPADRAFAGQFAKVWAGVDGLCLSAHAAGGLTLRVTADVDDARLPPEWRDLLSGKSLAPPGAAAPADALVAAQARFRLRTLVEVAAPFLPDGGREWRKQLDDLAAPAFGRDDWPAVLDALGPDASAWLRPAATDATLEGAAFVRLGGTPADAARLAPPVRQALDAVAHLWRVDHNRKNADQVRLRPAADGATAENPRGFPAGFAPSYRVSPLDGYAVIATTAELAAKPPPQGTDAAPHLRVSLAGLHATLRDHRAAAAKFLAGHEKRPAPDIDRELGDLVRLLEVGKTLELRLSRDASRVTATVTVEFVRPLK